MGIKNIGNSCHLNSVVQILTKTKTVATTIKNQKTNNNNKQENLDHLLHKCLTLLDGKTIEPDIMKNILNHIYPDNATEQQDAQETLHHILNKSKTKHQGKTIADLFSGTLTRSLECKNCKTKKRRKEKFQTLTVTMEENSLAANIKNLFKTENLKDFTCTKCQLKNTQSKYTIEDYPEILCIQLIRFDSTGKKLTKPLTAELNLTHHTDKGEIKYELLGSVNHFGSTINTGHYTSTIKEGDNTYYEYNDESVSKLDKIDTNNSYLLVYTKTHPNKKNQETETEPNIIMVSRNNASKDTIILDMNGIQPELLIDTGADTSLLKEKFSNQKLRDASNKANLSGIGKGKHETKGTEQFKIQLSKDISINHPFHIIAEDFPIKENGIIGRDFLRKFKADILYSTKELKIKGVYIKFTNTNQIVLPQRSETIVEIETPSNDTYINIAKEIRSGIFTANGLIQPKNKKARMIIANTRCQDATLVNFTPDLEPLDTYTISSYNMNTNHTDTTRINKITELISENLDMTNNIEENMTVLNLCKKYADIFFLDGDKLSTIKGVNHKIDLYTDTKPIHVQRYRLPQVHREEINSQVKQMLDEEKIKPSVSPFNSPLIVVPKKPGKDGKPKWRIVVDFRKLNDATIGDSYPLPNINDIFDQLGHSQYFSSLDLASGYHQIEMHKPDRHKTAFSTDFGHFEFIRMPFGLKNSQATFQRTINNVLRGFQGVRGFVYLDDVIIYGKNLRDHNNKLEEVFKIFREHNLKLQCEKCFFLKKEIIFLGHVVTRHGLKPNPTTVQAVQEFPQPKNIKETQSFLGLANYYRRFIPEFSTIAEPITKLTRKNSKFTWDKNCEIAFNTLKSKLITPPILKFPDFNKTFTLTTDASDYSLGAILSQNYLEGEFPIAYASRALGKAERNYSTIEKEMLAVYWAINNFRPYLYGKYFKVVTDHKPLVGDVKKIPSRMLKWKIKLSEYNYEISHKPGTKNTNADALSRIKHQEILALTRSKTKNITDNTPPDTKTNTTKDIQHNNTETEHSKRQIYPQKPQITVITDQNQRNEILKEYHNLPLGGHAGTWRTYKRIRILYFWPNMLTDINRFIGKCQKCKMNKSHRKTRVPLTVTSTSQRPFERVAFDLVGPLPTTDKNNKYLLTFQDDLTKFSGAIPIPNQEADTVAKALCEYYITKYGIPEKILTDQGSNFLSKSFKEVCKLLKLKHLTTTAFHPETNGALERSHNTLKEYLRNFTNLDNNNWDDMCHYAMFVYNTTPHCTTNFTPHELVYGTPATIPSAIKKEPEPNYCYDDYVNELKSRLRLAHHIARQTIIKKKQQTKKQYDRKTKDFITQPGDTIWLKNNNRRTKQDRLWLGPYQVHSSDSPTNTTIIIRNKLVKVHNNRLIKGSASPPIPT